MVELQIVCSKGRGGQQVEQDGKGKRNKSTRMDDETDREHVDAHLLVVAISRDGAATRRGLMMFVVDLRGFGFDLDFALVLVLVFFPTSQAQSHMRRGDRRLVGGGRASRGSHGDD